MNSFNKWKISIYLAAIFLAGIVAGAFVGFKAGQRVMFMPPRPEAMTALVCNELKNRLKLTPEQEQKIKPIVNDGIIKFQSIVGTDISTAFSNCNVRITAELTPEQRVKFTEIQKENARFLNNSPKSAPESLIKTP